MTLGLIFFPLMIRIHIYIIERGIKGGTSKIEDSSGCLKGVREEPQLREKKVEDILEVSSTDRSILSRARLTHGGHHRIRPLFYETDLQLTLPNRVPSTPPYGRVSTVHLPNSEYCMQPHHAPPELDSVATRRPFKFIKP